MTAFPRTLAGLFRQSCSVMMVLAAFGTSEIRADDLNMAGVKIVGIGATPCARFLDEIRARPPAERDYFAWAQGYMSGLLIRAPAGVDESLDLTPPTFPVARQVAFLREFCGRSAGSDFSDAVNALYRALRPLRGAVEQGRHAL